MCDLAFNAIYGTFDSDMAPVDVVDVTKNINESFLSAHKINIPSHTVFNQYFGDPAVGKRKFLQIEINNRKHNIIEDVYSLDIEISLNEKKKNIRLIYYAYINRKANWRAVVSGQLLQLKSYGLLDEVQLYVHITDTENIFDDAVQTVKEICKHAIISKSNKNYFEYPGIKLVYDLARQDPELIYIYLHTKGMSYNKQSRILEEIILTKETFEDWRRKMEPFNDKKITKIGLFPALEDLDIKLEWGAKGGWMWYNFWYAKGSCLIDCETPIVKERRWYWEDWLGGVQDDHTLSRNDCYNLYDEENQRYFTCPQAIKGLNHLIRTAE